MPSFKSLCAREVRLFEPQFLAPIVRHYKIRTWPGTIEKVGTKGEVTSSNQDSKSKVSTLVCSKWVCSLFFFLSTNAIEIRTELFYDKSMPARRCLVQDCNNGLKPRQGISLHFLLQAAVFWKLEEIRVLTSQELQPKRPFCCLLRAFHRGLFCQVLSCWIHETPCAGRNSIIMEEKHENDRFFSRSSYGEFILSYHCCAVT